MRGHTSSYYLDVVLMLIGAILIGFGEFIYGIILLAACAGIHFMMGDQMNNVAKSGWLGTFRMEALIDGVFAISMTLLVFNLQVPSSQNSLSAILAGLLPNFVAFLLSFVVLGAYWVAQHNASHYVKYSDRISLWINIAFLCTVAFVPFSASLLARFPSQQLAHFVYATNLFLLGMARLVNWDYSVANKLVDSSVDEKIVGLVRKRILFGPTVCVAAVLLSFVSTTLSLLLYFLIPLYFIIPSRLDAFWSR